MNILNECKRVFDVEISQLQMVRDTLQDSIVDIVHKIHTCEGKIVISGIGKPGHVARKLTATLSSLGIPSFFLHPAEALHGDLGSIGRKDIVVLISNSGNTKEVLNMFPSLRFIGCTTIAITSNPTSELATYSDIVLCTPKIQEACNLNLAPTSSTTVEMVIGHAIAVSVSKMNKFKKENFAIFHPAGTLGNALLSRVSDIMFTGSNIPVIEVGALMTDAVIEISKKGFGAVIITDLNGCIAGIITDGDIRRSFEKNIDIYSVVIDKIMTVNPACIDKDILAVDALKIMEQKMISVLPVADESKKPIGIIRNHDIIKNGVIYAK